MENPYVIQKEQIKISAIAFTNSQAGNIFSVSFLYEILCC